MDYFTIKQQFYTGNYEEVLKEVAKFNKTEDETLVYYKNRALMALSQFSEGCADTGTLGPVFEAYYQFLGKPSGSISALETAVEGAGRSPFALNLLVSALTIQGELDTALDVAVEGIDSDESQGTAELLLTAIQVTLLNNQPSVATTMFENFQALQESSNEDEIILNLAESYINFNQGKEITGSNFYFYEELSQSFPSWKTQLGLLNLHLQQTNLPEAKTIIDMLQDEFYDSKQESQIYKPDLLASEITYTILSGGNASELRSQLQQLKPSHPLCINNIENNKSFDQIVEKYSA
ncbi:unnamed protein product [Kluyveromyces dobzhanskii CBS 2104]|uniref:Coatomer subunit epsilon n=1 Tax=Kluyveromyces dobzhanskii CBS 2104 TaxID=1427455 RepID=A0A0A8L245_9SACH|nr:unnamed protein product [Kluyveromyces dobzhanskii CBS 2104]